VPLSLPYVLCIHLSGAGYTGCTVSSVYWLFPCFSLVCLYCSPWMCNAQVLDVLIPDPADASLPNGPSVTFAEEHSQASAI